MTIVFDHVHTDDLIDVLDKKGQPVYPYSSVPLKTIDTEKVDAREAALLHESIERSKRASETGNR